MKDYKLQVGEALNRPTMLTMGSWLVGWLVGSTKN
jgi:hypothetical protein